MAVVELIDLRSDTVTKPSDAMRKAMASARVGDDVYGEDPTVLELEAETASTLGKEAAVFVPSGTMGNLISALAHCQRGDEAIMGDEAHMFYYEVAGASALGGIQVRTVPNHGGAIDPGDVERAIRDRNIHFPVTRLVCFENTHNRGGGRVLTVEQTSAVADVAHRHGAAMHLDGARLFNAAVALQVPAAALAADADSVNVCFSKGLGAPVGSAVAGRRDFIERARKIRKMVGGGMRQAGVIAAAALLALRDGPRRLQQDHDNAKAFATALRESGIFDIDLERVQSNIISFGLKDGTRIDTGALAIAWRDAGVHVNSLGGGRFRAVTHLDVTRDQVIDAAARMIETVRRAQGGVRV
jgi:threonine aldolase